jgi:hypothetical protein
MAGARQNTGQEAIVNLSKKIDEMVTVVAEQYEQQTSILSSLDVVMKSDISGELKKQTSVLMNIEAKLDASNKKEPAVDSAGMQEYSKAFGSMAIAIVDLIEKADDKAADRLEGFFNKLAKGVNNLMKDVDKEKAEGLAAVLFAVTSGVLKFGLFMFLATPLLALSLVGSLLLGLNIKLILMSIQGVDDNSIVALSVVVNMGWGVLLFGFVMSLYVIFAVPAFIGAMAFGFTIRMMLKAIGQIEDPEAQFTAMYMAITLGWGVLKFGFIMSLYTIFAVPAFVGAMAFGFTVRLLLKAVGKPDPESLKAVQGVLALGWGVLAFGLIMSLYIILAPTAMIGSILFGLTIRLLLKAAGVARKGAAEAIMGISQLGIGVLWFGVAMALWTIIGIPAMLGAVLFGLTVRIVLLVSGAAKKHGAQAISALGKLWKGVLLFGVAMGLWLIIGIPAFLGAVLFGITAYITLLVLKEMGKKRVQKGIRGLFLVVGAIALFGLAFVLFNKFVKVMDVLFTLGTLGLTAIAFWLIGKVAKDIKKGAKALLWAVGAIAALGIAMIIWQKANVTWEGIAMLGATIVGLGVIAFVAGKFAKDIEKGSLALTVAALPIAALGVAMMLWTAAGVTWESIAILGATITGLAVAMGLIGMYESGMMTGIPLTITMGSLAVTATALPVAALGGAMMIWTAAGVKMADVLTLGGTIAMLAVEFGVFGLAAPFILIGAAAMTVASVALLPITAAVAIFKSSGFKKEDGDNLSYALNSIVDGFLGGKIPGGIVAAIKFAAQAAARAALLFLAVGPMALAGMALIPIAYSLKKFKEAKFGKEDADNLEYMVGSIVRAFGIVTDTERQKKMGFYVNPIDLMLGIASLSGAGRVLAGLAEGVQAWANLEVNEWEVVDAGTKDAKLVIKGRRKLNEGDFDAAAYGMSKVISAISKPFAEVGRLEKGQTTGNPVLDAIFSGGFVSAGIEALKRSGDTLVSLAEGVQAFANLEITTYEVVNAGTPEAKLVPKERRKLSDPEIAAAGSNIANIISVVAKAFADIGRQEKNSEGVFSGGFVTKGVSALSGVGDILGSITEGVIKMAYNEIPQFDLVNPGTPDAKLVPAKPLILKSTDLEAAALNIGNILGVVANSIADIGRQEAESSGWFSGGFVSKGIKALGNVGDIVAKISEAVIKFATGSIPQFDVVGLGTPDQKLVPGKPLQLSGTMLTNAAKKIGEILGVIGRSVASFGEWADGKEKQFDAAVDANKKIMEVVTSTSKSIEAWGKLKEPEKAAESMEAFLTRIQKVFDPKVDPSAKQKLEKFTLFSKNIEILGTNANAIEKIATNMDKIQNSMKLFQGHINGLDLKKLTLTNSMFNAIAALSKNPDAIAKAVTESMNKSFEALIKAIKELAAANTPAPSAGSPGPSGTPAPTGTPGPGKNTPAPTNNANKNKESKTSAGVQKVWIVGRDV